MQNTKIIIFTDGASKGNPGPGGWGAIVQLKAKSEKRKIGERVVELGGSDENTTNNRMEIFAVIKALEFLSPKIYHLKPIHIYSDSSYLVNGITKWLPGWEKNNWKTKAKEDVLNRDLWQKLAKLVSHFSKISWHIVSGHAGLLGNERADVIASAFAERKPPKLFFGLESTYSVSLKDFSYDDSKKESKTKKKSRSSKPAYSYVSAIGGVIKIYATWKECEARVKGKSGAKFKKSFSKEEEKEIIKAWSK